MSGIASSNESISRIFFRKPAGNRPQKIKRAVSLKDDRGWILETESGNLLAVGPFERFLNQNHYIIDEAAQMGSPWGYALEGLVALGRVSKEDLDAHRAKVGAVNAARSRAIDLEYVKKVCEQHGWSLTTEVAA